MMGRIRRAVAAAVLVLALLVASPAYAWQVVLAAAINFMAPGAGTIGSAAFYSALVSTAVVAAAYAYGRYQQRSQRNKAKAQAEASSTDRLANWRTAIGKRKLLLGRVRVGGTVLFMGSVGDDRETLYMVIELAAHQIDAVEAVYFDEEEVQLDAAGNVITEKWGSIKIETLSGMARVGEVVQIEPDVVPGSVVMVYRPQGVDIVGGSGEIEVPITVAPGGSFTVPTVKAQQGMVWITRQRRVVSSRAKVWWRLGARNQPGDAELLAAFPGTTSHRYEGMAVLILRLQWDKDVFVSSPTFTARVRGALVTDPRGPANPPVWSDNPALCARWLALHPMAGGMSDDELYLDTLIASLNVCDEVTTYTVGGITYTRKRYTCGYVFTCGDTTPDDGIDVLVEAMAGRKDWDRGRLAIFAGAYRPVAGQITDDWIVEGGSVSAGTGSTMSTCFNAVNGRFWAEDAKYTLVDYPRVVADEWVTADGAEFPKSIDLEAVTNVGQAQHVVGVLMREARQDDVLSMSLKANAWALDIGKTYEITIKRFGIIAKRYMLLSRQWSLDGAVRCTFKETGIEIYDQATGFPALDFMPNTVFPSWAAMPAIQILSVESGDDVLEYAQDGTVVTRMVVRWTPITDPRVEWVDVEWLALTDGASATWARYSAPADGGVAAIDAVVDRRVYLVRIRSRGQLASGVWSTQAAHRVLGKSSPPPAPTDFVVTQQTNDTRLYRWGYPDPAPRDMAGFDLRYIARAAVPVGTPPTWDAMLRLVQTPPLARSIERSQPGAGDWVFGLAAVDTSGNFSTPLFSDGSLLPPVQGLQRQMVVSMPDLQWNFNHQVLQDVVSGENYMASLSVANGYAGAGRIQRDAVGPFNTIPSNQLASVMSMGVYVGGAITGIDRLWRIKPVATSDQAIVYEVARTVGGVNQGWETLGGGSFVADWFDFRARTPGLWLEGLTLTIFVEPAL